MLVVLVVAGPGWAATVKRDTQDTLAHITDSIKDLVGLETDRNFIEEVKDINVSLSQLNRTSELI